MWTIRIPQVNRRWHKRWACHALHWIFITSTVTAKCFSCVCEVVSFNVRKNSFATLKLEQAAWGHNFNKVVLNETLKTYFHTAIIRKHAMEVSVRAQSLFYPKAISYVWRWWVGVFWESKKAHIKLFYPYSSSTVLFSSVRRLKTIPCRLSMSRDIATFLSSRRKGYRYQLHAKVYNHIDVELAILWNY